MDRRLIEELGESVFAVAVEPITRRRELRSPVLGFDTEYDSKSHELLSFQLSNGEQDAFQACSKLSVDTLAKACRRMVPADATEVVLAAYFSIAELQHLPTIEEGIEFKSFGSSIDVVFYSRRYALTVRTFDLARFFDRKPLSAVAESYGLEKLGGVNRARVSKASLRSRRFVEYAKRDARLCWQIVGKLREGFAPENVDPMYEGSAASTAAAAFRWRLPETLKPPASRVRLMGLLACWGGRAEALERGSFAKLHEYDLTSAYPNAARTLQRFPLKRDWRSVDHWRGFKGAIGGLGRFRFKFPADCEYPCLPVWTKRCQIYPLAGETYCTLDEARTAVDMGARVHVVEAHAFWSGTSLLSDYMAEVISERQGTKDPVRRTALKLLANSLIGKLAQRVVGPDMDDLVTLARRKGFNVDRFARLTREECIALGVRMHVKLGSMFFPEWNSLITGRVRAIMGLAVSECGAVYASTDAVWSRTKKPPAPYLGAQWGHVRSGPGVVARTRLARLGEHVAHHSIWKRTAGEAVLEHVADDSDETVSYTVQRPLKLKESIAKGEHYGRWVEETREASGAWDHKRKRAADGTFGPWDSADEYLAALQADARSRRDAARRGKARRNAG